MYRKIQNSLYKFDERCNAYICVYTRIGRTKKQLINEYENYEN